MDKRTFGRIKFCLSKLQNLILDGSKKLRIFIKCVDKFQMLLSTTSYKILKSTPFLIYDKMFNKFQIWTNIVEDTISRIKLNMREYIKIYKEDPLVYLGGLNTVVQADETVLSGKGIIKNPTSTSYSISETASILGAMDATNTRNFFEKSNT